MKIRLAGAAVVMGLMLTACGSTDPYQTYLDTAPTGAPTLSREDAQTRAHLGCGYTFDPGTVDYALQKAYDVC